MKWLILIVGLWLLLYNDAILFQMLHETIVEMLR